MAPIRTLLIANRGEIACRIIKTARAMGMRTVAVYSDADTAARHVRMADLAVRIGPAPARDSYLSIEALIGAARASGADAIHPGYGFLSERAAFAEACAAAGLIFVGPPASAIRAMGLKDEAKRLMEAAGVPVVPGYRGAAQDQATLAAAAEAIGYPVLIKAVAGGGGKGMRRVDHPDAFAAALAAAQREAQGAFGDARMLIERYVTRPRHIEIQVFADQHGTIVHLFERDCTAQRRHQKVIEEAPAPGMTETVRAAMTGAAIAAARSVGYVGAGTVEFIADGSDGLRPDGFWFMEMNTRLQVEHPVTEAITGLDLVEWQLRVAAGEPLPKRQDEIACCGHAIEARVYAEDPERGFLPATGPVVALRWPQGTGVRVDTGIDAGDAIGPHYDPMIAKVIAHGADRTAALDRLGAALDATVLTGLRTNLAFLSRLTALPAFRAMAFDTTSIERHLEALGAQRQTTPAPVIAAAAIALHHARRAQSAQIAAARSSAPSSPWDGLPGFLQFGEPRVTTLALIVDGDPMRVGLIERAGATVAVMIDGALIAPGPDVHVNVHGGVAYTLAGGRGSIVSVEDPLARDPDADAARHGDAIKAPMHGRVLQIDLAPGQSIKRGDLLFVVEAMKMEHAVVSPRDGVIAAVLAGAGAQVGEGAVLVRFAEAKTAAG